jgi:hypothetical protein
MTRPYAGRYDEEVLLLPRPLPLAQVLERDATLADWSRRHRLEARLTVAIRALLPRAVGPQVRVSATAGQCLELAAGAGAIAAVVRQWAPDLLAALRREGWDFTELRVRVQVNRMAEQPVKSTGNQRDASGARALFDLGDRLPEGPLRRSLARWSRRARGRA